MKVAHIYWFAYYNLDEASVRYRGLYALDYLKNHHQVSYDFVIPSYRLKAILHFLRVYLAVLFFRKRGSVIVFQKIYSQGFYAKALKLLLRIRRKNTLYDTDDAEHTRRPVQSIHFFMRNAEHCSCGSEALMEYARRFNKRVFLLTSPIIDHGVRKENHAQNLTIGWVGYFGAHFQNLNQYVFPALLNLKQPAHFKVLGVKNQEELAKLKECLQANPLIHVDAPLDLDWQDEASIYRHICDFDIGVAPLIENEFNLSKSAFKLKQCLSVGVPVLACPIGENKSFLEDGKSGYFCRSSEEYLSRLRYFQSISPVEWANYRKAAINSFHQYSVQTYTKVFLDYFERNAVG